MGVSVGVGGVECVRTACFLFLEGYGEREMPECATCHDTRLARGVSVCGVCVWCVDRVRELTRGVVRWALLLGSSQ